MQAARCIVFVGRKNHEKRFAAFTQMTERLSALGFPLIFFESDRAKASQLAEQRLGRISQHFAGKSTDMKGLHLRALRYLLKGVILMAGRHRWRFVRAALTPPGTADAQDLADFLDSLPFGEALLVAHSAGAIAATRVADHRKVRGIVCFGYAFKHPQRSAESYRTGHLRHVSKPLLIVQGQRDAYGADAGELRAILPAHCQIISPECDHDYFGLSEIASAGIWSAVEDLLRQAGFDTHG